MLLALPERGSEERARLFAWMSEGEEAWRGALMNILLREAEEDKGRRLTRAQWEETALVAVNARRERLSAEKQKEVAQELEYWEAFPRKVVALAERFNSWSKSSPEAHPLEKTVEIE